MPELNYPQPPQQNQGLLNGNPLQTISAIGELQNIGIRAQQAPALGQIPGQQLQNLQTQNQAARMQMQADVRQRALTALGNAFPGGATPGEIHNWTAFYARQNPIDATAFPETINSVAEQALNNPKGISAGISGARNMALSPEAASSRVAGPPDASGAPTTQPLAQANVGGTTPVGVPPGFAERAAGTAGIDTKLAGNWADAAEGSPARVGILGNLENALDKFTSGPGADWTKVAKSFVNRNVPLPSGWQFDPKSIASQEEFIKQSVQLAQQQFQSIGGTGTDSKFNSAFQTSPNETLTNLGNRGIIGFLKGNEDALQAKNAAWLQRTQANPNASARQFSQEFNTHFDPRVFQFKYLSPDERKQYVGKMDDDEKQKFIYNWTLAKKNQWINYDLSK